MSRSDESASRDVAAILWYLESMSWGGAAMRREVERVPEDDELTSRDDTAMLRRLGGVSRDDVAMSRCGETIPRVNTPVLRSRGEGGG
jgi:hypothetical protein